MASGILESLLTAGSNAVNQAVYTTATIAPAANALITVAIRSRRSSGPLTPTVTGGGMASWTLVASVDYDPVSTPLSRLMVFRALSSAPGSGPLTISFASSVSNVEWVVSQWTGVDPSGTNGSGAIVQTNSVRGDAVSTLAATLAPFASASDVAYGVVGAGLNGPAVTPGTGFTEIAQPTSGESTLLETEWATNLTPIAVRFSKAVNAALLGIEIRAGGSTPTLSITGGTIGTGTAFLFNPLIQGQRIPAVVITGPPGWNANNPFTCGVSQLPGMASTRSICWGFTNLQPVTGLYTAKTTVGTQTLTTQFPIEVDSTIPPVSITSITPAGNQLTVQWTAPDQAQSVWLRIDTDPFTTTIKDTIVLDSPGPVTFTGLPLQPGAQYRAWVFDMSKDVKTPGDMIGQFDVAVATTTFVVPTTVVSPTQSSVTAVPTSIVAATGSATITVTVKDASGTPIANANVSLTATGTGNTLMPMSGTTNPNGVFTASFSSTVVELKTITATANGVAITSSAMITVTPPALPGAITQTLLTAGGNGVNQSVYTTASIIPAPNALITVAVRSRRSSGPLTPTISGGGMTSWTPVTSVDYDPLSGSLARLVVFRAMSSTPGSGPIEIAFSSSVSNVEWVVSQWTGVDQTGANGAGAIGQTGSARGDAVPGLSVPLGAFSNADNVAYGVIGAAAAPPTVTPGNGFTQIAEPTSGESTLLEAEWAVNHPVVQANLSTAKNAALLGMEIKAGASLFHLRIGGNGSGKGTVTGMPGGVNGSLNCTLDGGILSGTCDVLFAASTQITLTAIPSPGSSFGGWDTAPCYPGTGTCAVTISQDIEEDARFNSLALPASLVLTTQPVSTLALAAITPAIQVAVRDAQGNTLTNYVGNVTVAIGTNPTGGLLSGTRTAAVIGGVATFSDLSIDKGGTGYTLTFSTPALPGSFTSSPFNIVGPTVEPIPTELATAVSPHIFDVPVVIVRFLPTQDQIHLDIANVDQFWIFGQPTLVAWKARLDTMDRRVKFALEEGSRFRGYNSLRNGTARPVASLGYRVVRIITFYSEIPLNPAGSPESMFADYHQIFSAIQGGNLVNNLGVKEFWIWAHNRSLKLDESNMSSPFTGDVSNSYRFPDDLPIYQKTYIEYTYNYGRTQAEAIHNHMHELESQLTYNEGRQDNTDTLFWNDFVGHVGAGSRDTRVYVPGRCGWTHQPLNTQNNYDYTDPTLVSSDCEDWRPDHAGVQQMLNANTWANVSYLWPLTGVFDQKTESQWYIYWMQNMPGDGNTIPYLTTTMTNWWAVTGDWDGAFASGLGLHH